MKTIWSSIRKRGLYSISKPCANWTSASLFILGSEKIFSVKFNQHQHVAP